MYWPIFSIFRNDDFNALVSVPSNVKQLNHDFSFSEAGFSISKLQHFQLYKQFFKNKITMVKETAFYDILEVQNLFDKVMIQLEFWLFLLIKSISMT